MDFADLSPLGRYLQEAFAHRDLNEVLAVPPTSEHLARDQYRWCAEHLVLREGAWVDSVEVSETASTSARYSPAGRPL